MLYVRTQGFTVVEDIKYIKIMKGNMNLVNTTDIEGAPSAVKYARTETGKIDFQAYEGLDAKIVVNKLQVNVKIIKARKRFGHLDLLVVPVSGDGEVWVERKNIQIINDPAEDKPRSPVKSTQKLNKKTQEQITLEAVREFLASQKFPLDKE